MVDVMINLIGVAMIIGILKVFTLYGRDLKELYVMLDWYKEVRECQQKEQ